MADYQLAMTERQADIVQAALEVFARLGIGQWRAAFEHLPLRKNKDFSNWHETLDAIGILLAQHTLHGIDGWQQSLSITSADVQPEAQIAWDLQQVIRHRLSWDRAVARGDVASMDAPRNWSTMCGVNYDEPMAWGPEPIATIAKVPPPGTRPAGADHNCTSGVQS